MAHIQDLTPCHYGHFSELRPLLAVGWLDPPFDFRRGPVKRAARDRLETLSNTCWNPIISMGFHACGFCAQAVGIDSSHADRGRGDLPRGSGNIIIPGRHVAYVAPDLILHYIDEHQY